MNTATHADFSVPVNYTVNALPGDNATQVAGTISMMCRYSNEDARRDEFVQWVNQKVAAIGGDPDPCAAAFQLTRECFYFQRDEATGGPLANDVVEVLVRPVDAVVLSANGRKVPGDCDCFSMLVASILLCLGVPCSFVTISGNRANPDAYSHVYVVAYPDDKDRRVAIDASHGAVVGWEAPTFGKYTEWTLSGAMGGGQAIVILAILLGAIYVIYGRGI